MQRRIQFRRQKQFITDYALFYSVFLLSVSVINIHTNSNYLSGSSSMFNSTTDRLYRLRVTWHSFTSIYFVHWKRTVGRLPGTRESKTVPAFAATPCAPYVRTTERHEGLTSIGHRLLGRVAVRYRSLRPPSPFATVFACTERERLHSHDNARRIMSIEIMHACARRMKRKTRRTFVGPISDELYPREPTSGAESRLWVFVAPVSCKSFPTDRCADREVSVLKTIGAGLAGVYFDCTSM